MFCKNCGKEARGRSLFCSHCGARLTAPPGNTYTVAGHAKKAGSRKTDSIIGWAIAVVFVAVVITLALVLVMFSGIIGNDEKASSAVLSGTESNDWDDDNNEDDPTDAPTSESGDQTDAPQTPASVVLKDTEDTEDTLRLAFCLPTYNTPYFAVMKEAVEAEFPRDGIEVTFYDAQNDQAKQNNDIKRIILAGMDGVVLVPVSSDGAASAVQLANQSGIAVVTLDRTVSAGSADVASFVSYDNYDMGKQAAALLIAALQEQYPDDDIWNILVVEGAPKFQVTYERGDGIADYFEANSRVNVLASVNGEYLSESATKLASYMMDAFPELQAIICHSDLMAEGCYRAAVEHDVADDLIIVGMEGSESVVQKTADGTMSGTVLINPRLMAITGVNVLADFIVGHTVSATTIVPVESVNTDNAQQILDDKLSW